MRTETNGNVAIVDESAPVAEVRGVNVHAKQPVETESSASSADRATLRDPAGNGFSMLQSVGYSRF